MSLPKLHLQVGSKAWGEFSRGLSPWQSQPGTLDAPEVCSSLQAGPNPDTWKFSSTAELASLWGTDERTLLIAKSLLKTLLVLTISSVGSHSKHSTDAHAHARFPVNGKRGGWEAIWLPNWQLLDFP